MYQCLCGGPDDGAALLQPRSTASLEVDAVGCTSQPPEAGDVHGRVSMNPHRHAATATRVPSHTPLC